jgi:hypothetical protein
VREDVESEELAEVNNRESEEHREEDRQKGSNAGEPLGVGNLS